MIYEEIKSEIDKTANQIAELRKALESYECVESSIKDQLDGLTASHKSKVDEVIDLQRVEFNLGISSAYDKKIEECINAKSKLRDLRTKKLDKINSLDYTKKFSSEFNIKKEEKLCDDIKSSIDKFYGKDLAKELRRVKTVDCCIDVKDIVPSLRLHSSLLEKSEKFTDLAEKLSKGVEYKEGDKAQLVLVGAVSTTILVSSFVFYPATLALLVLAIGYNSYKSHFFLKCNSVCKAFDDNLKEVKGHLDSRVREEISKDVKSVNDEVNNKMSKFDSLISSLENERDLKLDEEKANFKYDVSEIESSNRDERLALEDRYSEVKKNVLQYQSTIKTSIDRLNELKDSLDQTMKTLVDVYMPKELSLNKFMPEDYLVDVKDNKPEILALQKKSCAFIYSELDKANQFVHLLFYQTLLRTDPSLYKFNVVDTTNVDTTLGFYEDKDKSVVEPVVRTVSKPKDITPFLEGCDEEIRSRLKLTRNFNSMDDYNKYMLSEDCPMETYNFLLIRDPDLVTLNSDLYKSIIVNGPKVGYYVYFFLKDSEFNNSNESTLGPLVNDDLPINFFQVSTSVSRRAQMFYRSKLERDKS